MYNCTTYLAHHVLQAISLVHTKLNTGTVLKNAITCCGCSSKDMFRFHSIYKEKF